MQNGFAGNKYGNPEYISKIVLKDNIPNDIVYAIIFNHDFAKALWGGEIQVVPADPYTRVNWKYHLQQMVIADDPIDYAYEAVFGK